MSHIGKKEARELIKLSKQMTREQRLQEQEEKEREQNSIKNKVKRFFGRD